MEKKTKTCEVRLHGNGIDQLVANVTLDEKKDAEQFAKKGYSEARASLKRLVLDGYKLQVIDGANKHSFDLKKFVI